MMNRQVGRLTAVAILIEIGLAYWDSRRRRQPLLH